MKKRGDNTCDYYDCESIYWTRNSTAKDKIAFCSQICEDNSREYQTCRNCKGYSETEFCDDTCKQVYDEFLKQKNSILKENGYFCPIPRKVR